MAVISRLLFILGCCVILARPAIATDVYTYSPHGPITLKGTVGDTVTQVIAIKNKRPYNTSTNVALNTAGGHFSMNVTSYYITLYRDSTFNVIVKYVPTAGDTSFGWLRIYDSLTVPDTVFITGMDTTDQYSGPAWQVIEDSSYNAGDIIGRPDSAVLYVKNFSNASVSVTSTMLLGSYGFTAVGSQQRTIASGSVTRFYYRFDPKYAFATASIRISGAGYTDTFTITGRSSTAPPHEDTLTFDYNDQYFGPIAPGDSAFRTATIYNWTDSAVTISDLGFIDDQGTLSLVDAPALPYTIPVHDSLVVLMRFIAPATPSTDIHAWLYLESAPPSKWQAMRVHGSSNGCVSVDPDFLVFGLVPLDSVATRTVRVTNHTDSAIVIDSLYLRSNGAHTFTLNTQAPLSISANSDTVISISFTATPGGEDTVTLVFTTSGCDVRIMGVTASIDSLFITDTTHFELFADSTQTLYFSGDSAFATQVYSFVNDLTDSLNIIAVSLKQGTYFEIFDVDPAFPQFIMAPQDVMDVTLRFLGSPGTYEDTLVIVTENAIIPVFFPIHAVVQASDVRSGARTGSVSMLIAPNPASGPVSIRLEHAQSARVEVLDVMGKNVSQVRPGTSWAPGELSKGTYFVRATGIDDSGAPFVITQRLVIK